jgi:hypothetical protein
MNKKKAQANIGTILVACFLFVILLMGGFNFYLGSLYSNGVTVPDGINQTELDASFEKFKKNYTDARVKIDDQKNRIPVLSEIADFFATGADSIKAAWDSIGFMKTYINFVQKNTVIGSLLPASFWSMFLSVITIILTFIGLSALWRWNLTR